MSQRSKAACTIAALTVGFGCAVIGVGGADGGTRAYARHVRDARVEARLAGIALAHRSPEQVVLAIAPKHHAVRSDAHVAVTPVSSVSATTATTAAATTTTPATTTTSTSTTPANNAPAPTEVASENAAPPTDTSTTDTTTTGTNTTTTGTTTTGPTTTGTTTTGTTTTGTTTTGTTTTGTTTTGTTTTGTTTTSTGTTTTTTGTTTTGTGTTTTGTTASATSTTGNGASTTLGHGRQPGSTSTTTTALCHGRCDGSGGSSSATQAAVPAASSASSAGNFNVTPATVTPASVATSVPTTPVNDSSSTNLNPVSSGTASTTATTPTTTPTTTPPGTQSSPGLLHINLPNIVSALKHSVGNGSGSSRRSTAGVITATGTGATTGGTGTGGAPTGTTGTTGTGTAGAATAANTGTHTPAHRTAKQTSSSGGAGITAPIGQTVRYIDHFVNVIPTAVWLALGAAFALMLAFAAIAFRSSRRARRRENEFAAISAAALTDALTGILNRRGFTEAAERELARASRYERPFVLAYVDVRGLKSVNDTEGHLMGDELIKTVAELMKESARADDVVGRIGGDEFALLLGEQTAESAGPVFRRIGARVEEARAGMEISVPWELTIGMASFPQDGTTLEELLEVSDRRLYEQRGIALR